MQECKKAFAVSPQDRLPTLHLPHKNQFIPNEPEVEKQEMDEQALNLGSFAMIALPEHSGRRMIFSGFLAPTLLSA